MLSALYAIAHPPGVRLSVTRVDQSKIGLVKVQIMKFSPYGSAIRLVFAG